MTIHVCSASSIKPTKSARNAYICFALFSVVWTLLAGCATKEPLRERFQAESGAVVELPGEGSPDFDRNAGEVTSQIRQLDTAIKDWQRKSTHMDPALASEILRILRESRDAAVQDIALAYRIPQQTSGPIDNGLIALARNSVAHLLETTKSPTTGFKFEVSTVITSKNSAAIHYVPLGEFERSSSPDWQSYTKGQLLRIGRYMFRVQPADRSRRAFTQKLEILREPSEHELVPRGM